MARECGSCTKCCEGWLSANIHGRAMYKGNPCFFVDKEKSNCSIYDKRPDLCKKFLCAWMTEEELFPNWMKPNLVNQIIVKRVRDNITFYDIVEAGEKISVEVLNYLVILAIEGKINLKYQLYDMPYFIGDEDFLKLYSLKRKDDNKILE